MLFYFSQLASYMKAVNDIYDRADFDGIQLVNFKVKFLTVSQLFFGIVLFILAEDFVYTLWSALWYIKKLQYDLF